MIEGTSDMAGEFWSNVLVILAGLFVLLVIWLILRAIVEFVDNQINFLSILTPGDVAVAIMLGMVVVGVLAYGITELGVQR